MFRSGLCSITFRKLTPREVVDLCAKAGVDGIEWGGDVHAPHGDTATAAEVRKMTQDAGLQVASYGSYYRVVKSKDEGLDFPSVLDSAQALGAPIVRVWAGGLGSADADQAYRDAVAEETRAICDMAAAENIRIAYEFHGGTLTDTNDSALRLLKDVDHPNLTTYWQPVVFESMQWRLDGLRSVLPWLSYLHVFQWIGEGKNRKRLSLAEGADDWSQYLDLAAEKQGDRYALVEFVKDDEPEQFIQDAAALKQWLAALNG